MALLLSYRSQEKNTSSLRMIDLISPGVILSLAYCRVRNVDETMTKSW
jgi:prolipoprotein diacylglyceryltransferase